MYRAFRLVVTRSLMEDTPWSELLPGHYSSKYLRQGRTPHLLIVFDMLMLMLMLILTLISIKL